MRLAELAQPKKSKLKNYAVRLKIPGLSGAVTITDTIVVAVNPQMARKIVQVQYNVPHILIGQPREVKPR
jgi:hypothetical protein